MLLLYSTREPKVNVPSKNKSSFDSILSLAVAVSLAKILSFVAAMIVVSVAVVVLCLYQNEEGEVRFKIDTMTPNKTTKACMFLTMPSRATMVIQEYIITTSIFNGGCIICSFKQ